MDPQDAKDAEQPKTTKDPVARPLRQRRKEFITALAGAAAGAAVTLIVVVLIGAGPDHSHRHFGDPGWKGGPPIGFAQGGPQGFGGVPGPVQMNPGGTEQPGTRMIPGRPESGQKTFQGRTQSPPTSGQSDPPARVRGQSKASPSTR